MSDDQTKLKTSKRRHKAESAAKRQYKIAKEHGMNPNPDTMHKFAKHHAMDCGNPGCMLCGNPRKIFKEKTMQEKRFYQDTENRPHKHGNGIDIKDLD